MKKSTLFCCLLLFSAFIFAQETTISGSVNDNLGNGLQGVTIALKGGLTGAISGLDGNFELNVPDPNNSILVFSYLGYTTKEVSLNGRTQFKVVLDESTLVLNEVVISALGIEREAKSLTYARQAINPDDIDEAKSINFVTALAGKAAGVEIRSAQTPTGSNRVVIRGVNSLTGNNQPLFVVDGIPLDNPPGDDNVSVWNSGDDIDYGNPISNINPNDIENIEILKGPNAAAMYGSRGANGVILITTKKGVIKEGIGVTFNSNVMFIKNIQFPDFQYVYGGGNNMRMVNNKNHLDKETGFPTPGSFTRSYGAPMLGFNVMNYNGEAGTYDAQPGNIESLYQTGRVITNSITINKATEKSSVRFAYTNTNSSFTIEGMEVQDRQNLSLRAITDLTDKLNLDINVMYTHDDVKNRMYQNGSNRNPANGYMYMHGNMHKGNLTPYKDAGGLAFNFRGPFHNPLWNLYELSNQDQSNRLISGITLTYELADGLSLRGRAMGDINIVEGSEFNNFGASYDADGYYRAFNRQNYSWNYEGLLTYNKNFGDFSLVANVGGNLYDRQASVRDSRINSLLLANVQSLSNSSATPVVNESDINQRIASVFGSASIGYKGMVYLDATARNDWSSTLPASNNSYFYPSIGASFVLSELIGENDILSFAKIRASYAQVGNDASPYQTATTYSYGGNYNSIAWVYLDRTKNNADLKPELTTSLEVGLEAMFLKNRISVNATYYQSSTVNQIVRAQVSSTTGFQNQVFNAGEIANKGWELFVSAKPLDGKFKWSIDANWATNQSEVVSLVDGVDRFLLREWFNLGVFAEVGQPFGVLRGNKGLRDANGNLLVKSNGRVMVESDAILGNVEPDWMGGLRNSFSFKGFSLSFLLDVKMGGDFYSGTMLKSTNFGIHSETLYGRDEYFFSSLILGESNNERKGVGLFDNAYVDDRVKGAIYENSYIGVLDPETEEFIAGDPNVNYINTQPYFYDIINSQERVIFDASYVKLREVIFGFNIPERVIAKTPLQSARVSLVGRNLAILHQNTPKGLDPEASTTSGNGQGIEYGSFLPTATYGVNVKVSF